MSRADERIYDAFLQLLKEKTISDITVDSIIEKAGVCKATFYRNFENKYDLLDKSIIYTTNKYVKPAPEMIYEIDQWREYMRDHLSRAKKSRTMNSYYRHEIGTNHFYETQYAFYCSIFENRLRKVDPSAVDGHERVVSIAASVCARAMTDWVKNRYDLSVDELIDLGYSFLSDEFKKLLGITERSPDN